MFGRKLVGIAQADDAAMRFKAQDPGGQCHRRNDGFQMAGRNVDNQPFDLTLVDAFMLAKPKGTSPVTIAVVANAPPR